VGHLSIIGEITGPGFLLPLEDDTPEVVSLSFARFCKKRAHIERVAQAYACAFCSEPPKPASLCDAGFAARVVVLGCGFSCARVWLFEDFD